MSNKKGPITQIGPQEQQKANTTITRFCPIRKARFDALYEILQHDTRILLDHEFKDHLAETGWGWRELNTSANDLATAGLAKLEQGRYPGMFRLVLIEVDPEKGGDQ